VDLKYLTSTQIVEVVYEGRTRQFSLISVSPRRYGEGDAVGDVTFDLHSLSVDSHLQIWIVGWDLAVYVIDDDEPRPTRKVAILSGKRYIAQNQSPVG
jgi:AAA family ATPase